MDKRNRLLFTTVFLTGAGVLILEIAAVRMLTPYYGSSLAVFSSVLSIILAALSVGYWYGGKRADRLHSFDDLYRIITISGVLVLLLLLIAQVVLPKIALSVGASLGPLIFSSAFFFAPAFLLGIVSPYIIKLQSEATASDKLGSVVGQTFFWGTVGSISGSLLTGFWLLPSFGVQQTISGVGILLIVVGLLVPLLIRRPKQVLFSVATLSLMILLLLASQQFAKQQAAQYVFYGEGRYSSIKISDVILNGRIARLLNRDTNNSSATYLTDDEPVFNYIRFATLYKELHTETKSMLMLGGGAYTLPRYLAKTDPELALDIVEFEPVLFQLAQTYFDYTPTATTRNFSLDARVFLAQTDTTYDVIFADTFGTDLAAPFHLTTVEFYELLRSRLNPDGILILNYVGIPKTTRPSLTGSVIKTLNAVFPTLSAFGMQARDQTKLQNIMFVARNGETPLRTEDIILQTAAGEMVPIDNLALDIKSFQPAFEYILTDDHAPVERLMAKQR